MILLDNAKTDDLLEAMMKLGNSIAEVKDIHSQLPGELHMFMDALFGKKRLLILEVDTYKNNIITELKDYCNEKELEICMLDGKNLKADDIKGEFEIIYKDEMPYSIRKKPHYVSDNRQLIIVEGLTGNTDIEVLRAFMYMASLEVYYDDIANLPKDKLPFGSAYVFIADNNFPLKKFESISSYWKDEAAILDLMSI